MHESEKTRIGRTSAAVERFAGDKRPNYFAGQILSADDLRAEQQYLIGTRRRLNRALHGWGIATGLTVTIAADAAPASVVVEPGLALDRDGRELYLATATAVEIEDSDRLQYVMVEYTERETDPAVSMADDVTAMSRIEEGVRIWLSPDDRCHDGIAIARLVMDSCYWTIDCLFAPPRCR